MPNVPPKTSVWNAEPKHDKYIIQFAPELVQFIKEKSKTRTYRFGMKYDYLQVGDKVTIQETGTETIVGPAEVTGKEKTAFKDLPLNIDGHETYESKERQRQVFNGYYAYIKRPIQDDDEFLVIDFKLL